MFYLLNICSLRVHKERLLQVPWEAEVVAVVSVVVDEECVGDEKCVLMGQQMSCALCLSNTREGHCMCVSAIGVARSIPYFGLTR